MTLRREEGNVYLRRRRSARKGFALRDYRTVFGNQIVPGKHHIRGRFSHARIRIHISADIFTRLGFYEQSPVIGFSYRFVGSGQIDDDRRARGGVSGGRRIAYPKILADLAGDFYLGAFFVRKEQSGPERRIRSRRFR